MTFVFLATPAFAKPAIVVGVSDGDTLTVEWEDGSRGKVRLFGVDCPETKVAGKWETQPYGRKATAEGRGLWYHVNPTAPWDWRKGGSDGE